ncbi:hypothetical protein ACH4S8_01900 [Streptomyces sp. NPDC021080]|uniref:hypothetical protein n=1 Tax=Streptomyces sp. NPDC021080 TaxID=3365110 RepID=UPI0037934F2A
MAAGRDCLRSSHAGRLMGEAASLRMVSKTDPAVQAAWDSEGEQVVHAQAVRPQIPVVSAPAT